MKPEEVLAKLDQVKDRTVRRITMPMPREETSLVGLSPVAAAGVVGSMSLVDGPGGNDGGTFLSGSGFTPGVAGSDDLEQFMLRLGIDSNGRATSSQHQPQTAFQLHNLQQQHQQQPQTPLRQIGGGGAGFSPSRMTGQDLPDILYEPLAQLRFSSPEAAGSSSTPNGPSSSSSAPPSPFQVPPPSSPFLTPPARGPLSPSGAGVSTVVPLPLSLPLHHPPSHSTSSSPSVSSASSSSTAPLSSISGSSSSLILGGAIGSPLLASAPPVPPGSPHGGWGITGDFFSSNYTLGAADSSEEPFMTPTYHYDEPFKFGESYLSGLIDELPWPETGKSSSSSSAASSAPQSPAVHNDRATSLGAMSLLNGMSIPILKSERDQDEQQSDEYSNYSFDSQENENDNDSESGNASGTEGEDPMGSSFDLSRGNGNGNGTGGGCGTSRCGGGACVAGLSTAELKDLPPQCEKLLRQTSSGYTPDPSST